MTSTVDKQSSNNGGIIYIPEKDTFFVDKGFGEAMIESARKYPAAIADIEAAIKQEVTYAELLSKTIRIAQNFRSKEIQPEDVIVQCNFNNLDYAPTTIAISAIGAIPALIDSNMPYSKYNAES